MKIALPLLLPLLVVLLFGRAASFDFLNFDDDLYVTANPVVTQGLTADGVRWALTTTEGGHWHPLSWLSHMADVSLFGLEPAAHHLGNVLLHTVNAAILLSLVSTVTGSAPVGFFSALLSALLAAWFHLPFIRSGWSRWCGCRSERTC